MACLREITNPLGASGRYLGPLCLPLVFLMTLFACGDAQELPETVDPSGSDTAVMSDIQGAVGDALDTAEESGPDPEAQAELLTVPETQRWQISGLTAPVHVVRTEADIPHIYASNREDLGRVLGFIVARDRFFFMDMQRRLGLGTLSSLLGDVALGPDMEARNSGMAAVAERMDAHMGSEMRAYLNAFTDGVNAYIAAVGAGELPAPSELEVAASLLGVDAPADLMAPFSVGDLTAMTAVVMYQTNYGGADVGRSAQQQALVTAFDGVLKAELRREGFTREVWDDVSSLFPGTSSAPGFGTSAPTVPNASATPGQRTAEVEDGVLARLEGRLSRFRQRLKGPVDQPFGSNAWAVGSAGAAGGVGLVAGDGHLPLSVPALMYQVGMDTAVFGGGDTHQLGLFLTPLPIMGAGTNGHVGWSMVNPVFDITDWYREELQLDAQGRPSATLFQGEWRPLVSHEERYTIAEVSLLESVGRTESWTRYETFDGRW